MTRHSVAAFCAAALAAVSGVSLAAQMPDFPPPPNAIIGDAIMDDANDGEPAIAARYRSWIEAALMEGRVEAAEIALERA